MKELPNKYFVFDLETTGFNPRHDRILEIGCMKVEGDEVEYKQWILNWNIDISDEVIAIHGISREICEREGMDPKEAVKQFVEYTGILSSEPPILVGHNCYGFDIPFLFGNMCELYPKKEEVLKKREGVIARRAHDTAAIFKAMKLGRPRRSDESRYNYYRQALNARVPGLKYNLGVVCDHYEISREGVVQHRTEGDVFLTNEIFKKLISGGILPID